MPARKKKTTGGESKAPRAKPVQVEKQIPNVDARNPEIAPVFINEVQIIRVGTDIYLDLCIVPSDDILAAESNRKVRLLLRERVVMSVNTFATLRRKIEEVYQKIRKGEEILDDDLRSS